MKKPTATGKHKACRIQLFAEWKADKHAKVAEKFGSCGDGTKNSCIISDNHINLHTGVESKNQDDPPIIPCSVFLSHAFSVLQ